MIVIKTVLCIEAKIDALLHLHSVIAKSTVIVVLSQMQASKCVVVHD